MPRDSHGALRAPLLRITDEEAAQIAWAVQWAGHFATRENCAPGGPAFSHIAPATRALERCGVKVYHSAAARTLVEATQ